MKQSQYFILTQNREKHKSRSESKQILRLPKLKFGRNSNISSPYTEQIPFPSQTPHSISKNPSLANTISLNFLDTLMSRYEDSQSSKVNIAKSFVKPEEISLTWKKLSTTGFIPDSRSQSTMNVFNKFVYLFGGERSDESNDIKRLNYESLKWEKLRPTNLNSAEIPNVRSGHTCVTYKNSLVLYGGFSHFDAVARVRNCNPLIYVYDLSKDLWKSYKPTGLTPISRRNHCAVVVGNSMLIYSGIDNSGLPVKKISVLNLETMSWTTFNNKGEVPEFRENSSLTSVYHGSLKDSYTFDIFTVPKHFDNVFTKQTSGVYLFGGLSEEGNALNDLYVGKGQKSKTKSAGLEIVWKKVFTQGKEPVARFGHCANLINGVFVVVGGRNDSISGGIVEEIAVLRISCWRWETALVSGEIPHARIGAATTEFTNKILLFGGMRLTGFTSSGVYQLEIESRRISDFTKFHRIKTFKNFS